MVKHTHRYWVDYYTTEIGKEYKEGKPNMKKIQKYKKKATFHLHKAWDKGE